MRALTIGAAIALVCGGLAGCSWFGGDDHRDDRDSSRNHRDSNDGFSRGGPREDWNRAQYDPVCGMQVDPKTAVSYNYNGRTYYFHSTDCARKFRDHPDQYFPRTREDRPTDVIP